MKRLFIQCSFIICFMAGFACTAFTQEVTTRVGGRGNRNAVSDSAFFSGDGTYINDSTQKRVLPVFNVYALRTFAKKGDQKKYDRLVRIVKKVYPLAKMAGIRMNEYGAAADTMTRREINDLIAVYEDEVKNKYGADLKKLTFREGLILIRLIDRETKYTPYAIVKELKGSFNAFFYQALAGLFDYDLKTGFSPQTVEEDGFIDEICIMIDRGQL